MRLPCRSPRSRPSRPAIATPTSPSATVPDLRARAPRSGRADQRAGAPASGGRHARGDRRRPRLLRLAPPFPGRSAPGLAGLGPPQHALERHRAVAGRPGARRAAREPRLVAGGPGNPSSSRSGHRTACSTSPRTAAAGGTSTAWWTGRHNRWPQWPATSAARSGCSAGAATPSWRRVNRRGLHRAHRLRLLVHETGGVTRALAAPGAWLSSLVADGRSLHLVAASPTASYAVVRVDTATGETATVQAPPRARASTPPLLSVPQQVTFPTPDGPATSTTTPPPTRASPPRRRDLPPLLVTIHGGPTAAARPVLDPEVQFWTSRGFALADVDYGGSTGYGRGLLGAPASALGDRGRARLRPGRRPPGRRREGRPGPPGHPGRERRRLHHPGRPRFPRASSPPGPATTASPTWNCSPGTPTSSSPATSTGWSDPTRRNRPPTGSALRSTTRKASTGR